ncbi:CRAL-TRIO domain-containing protein [Haematococcus lacustris]
MPKAPPPSILLKFNGRLEWPLEPGVDDWGLTPDQQESYVEQFRRILAAKNAWREDQHDFFQLRRFLRARSYDLEKATAMWLNNVAFKAEFKVDTILQDFLYDERDSFLRAYPQGYHKVDKQGRPIFIQLLGQLDIHKLKQITTEQRMVKYHIQEYERCIKVIMPVCSHLAGRHIDTTFGIMDVKGVGMSHLTGETKRLMGLITKYDQDNYPELLGHICIINAPSVFRMIWGVVKGMLDARTQGKIEILGTDYLPGLLKWVDINNLPEFLGGRSKGSLLEDIGPWSDHDVLARLGLSDDQLRLGHCPAPSVSNMSRRSSSMVHSDGDRLASHGSMRRPSEGNHHHVGAPHDLVRLSESDGYQSPGGSTDAQNSFRWVAMEGSRAERHTPDW